MNSVRDPFRVHVRISAIICGCAAFICLASSAQQVQNAQVRPTTRTPDCTTSGCHSDVTGYKFLHAPTAAGACEMCHVPVDPVQHTFKYKHEGAAMCDFCHIGKTDVAGLHVHKPVQDGQCIQCHNPHGSQMRNLINGATTSAMCLTCHDSILKDRQHVHTPIVQGDCLGCHKAHSSVMPNLLVAQGRELCLKCHSDVVKSSTAIALAHPQPSGSLAGNAQLPEALPVFTHDPFKGECTQCHEQHASQAPTLLKQDITGLCTSCHADVATSMSSAIVQHSAMMDDRACLNCHSPHESHTKHLLKDKPVMLCLECHGRNLTRPDGSTVNGVAGEFGMRPAAPPSSGASSGAATGAASAASNSGTAVMLMAHLHGPIAEGGDCGACHTVHGGAHRALLVRPYTQSFYQSFDSNAYALCLGCHKQELATEKTTTTATNFRNGDVNLHYLHITAPGESGRSCRVCHATHAANNPQQVRESSPFGQWNVPINFTATETGGSCGAGCHRARTYDRVSAVTADSQLPSK